MLQTLNHHPASELFTRHLTADEDRVTWVYGHETPSHAAGAKPARYVLGLTRHRLLLLQVSVANVEQSARSIPFEEIAAVRVESSDDPYELGAHLATPGKVLHLALKDGAAYEIGCLSTIKGIPEHGANLEEIARFLSSSAYCRDASTRETDGKIHVVCPKCSKAIKAPASAAGRKGKCPGCGEIIVIKSAEGDRVQEQMPTSPASQMQVERKVHSESSSRPVWRQPLTWIGAAAGVVIVVLCVVIVAHWRNSRANSPVVAKTAPAAAAAPAPVPMPVLDARLKGASTTIDAFHSNYCFYQREPDKTLLQIKTNIHYGPPLKLRRGERYTLALSYAAHAQDYQRRVIGENAPALDLQKLREYAVRGDELEWKAPEGVVAGVSVEDAKSSLASTYLMKVYLPPDGKTESGNLHFYFPRAPAVGLGDSLILDVMIPFVVE